MCGVYDIRAPTWSSVGRRTNKVPDRPLPGRRAARGRVLPGVHGGRRRPRARHRPARAAAPQPDPRVPVRDGARLDLRLRRLRALPRPRGGARQAGAATRRRTRRRHRLRHVRRACRRHVRDRRGRAAAGRAGSWCEAARRRTARGTTRRSRRSRPTGSGVGLEDVELRFGDSKEVPRGVGTFASRSVAMGGSAVVQAVDALKEKCAAVAAGRSMSLRERGGGRAGDPRRAPASSPSSSSRRAPTEPSSRSSARPVGCACCASPQWTTPGRS